MLDCHAEKRNLKMTKSVTVCTHFLQRIPCNSKTSAYNCSCVPAVERGGDDYGLYNGSITDQQTRGAAANNGPISTTPPPIPPPPSCNRWKMKRARGRLTTKELQFLLCFEDRKWQHYYYERVRGDIYDVAPAEDCNYDLCNVLPHSIVQGVPISHAQHEYKRRPGVVLSPNFLTF